MTVRSGDPNAAGDAIHGAPPLARLPSMRQNIASPGADWEKTAAEVWATLREVAERDRKWERRQDRLDREIVAERRARAEAMEAERRARAEEWARTEEALRALSHESRKTEASLRRLSEESRKTEDAIRRLSEESRKTQESLRKTDKQIRKTDRTFNDQWGKLMESLVEGDLVKLLQRRGVNVTQVYARRHRLGDARQREVDILAWNGTDVVAVEVKSTLLVKHVRRFEETMWEVPTLLPLKGVLRYYGAVAYLRAEQKSEIYARHRGFFVIRATGSSASITNEDDFRPRDFSGPGPGGP